MKDYHSFAHSHIGYSHITSQKPCQDCSLHYQTDVASVIIVSDGHGSANFTRSDRGSRFACEAARQATDGFLEKVRLSDLDNPFLRDDVVNQLCKNIMLRWNIQVDADVANDPFTPEEVEKVSDKYRQRYLLGESAEHAYGCTLILVILTRDFCLAIRNGDGECVCVDSEGQFQKPIPWNENCELNVTTSLCDSEAIDNFRYYYSRQLPAAIFAGSDGIDDSYTNEEELFNLYRNICLRALDEGPQAAADRVSQLLPEITKRGSNDDVSIAGLINPAALEDARTAMEIALEIYQMQLEAHRQERRKRVLIKDIKVAEKKKAKAYAQWQELRRKTQSNPAFTLFRRQPEDNILSLSQEEQQLLDIINGADSDIARFKKELIILEGGDPGEEAVIQTDGLSDCNQDVAAQPEIHIPAGEETSTGE